VTTTSQHYGQLPDGDKLLIYAACAYSKGLDRLSSHLITCTFLTRARLGLAAQRKISSTSYGILAFFCIGNGAAIEICIPTPRSDFSPSLLCFSGYG
jgi:hypothetical protein